MPGKRKDAPGEPSDEQREMTPGEVEEQLRSLRRRVGGADDRDRLAAPIGYSRKHGGLPPGKKSLGQFWLRDQSVTRWIVEALDPQQGETVLEVGPGGGALTEPLLDAGARVTAVEIDRRMVEILQQRFEDREMFNVVHADILRSDWLSLTGVERFSLTGNLPYHITSSLLFQVLDCARLHPGTIRRVVVMVQLEVGRRIVAGPGDSEYGLLSVLTRLWAEPELAGKVPRTAFQPPPKVDAAVLKLDLAAEPRYPLPDWPRFKRLVKGTFQYRRKMLKNSLPGIADIGPWREIDFDWTRRPQTVSTGEFARIAEELARRSGGKGGG